MNTIKNFISQVKQRGTARVNRYRVRLPFASPDYINMTELYCESVTLPGMSNNTNPYIITGEAIDFPTSRVFEPVSMTFYVDSKLSIKTWFDAWVRAAIDDRTKAVNYYNQYADRTVEIDVLDATDTPVYKCTLIEAWPKTVGDVTLSAVDNSVMRLNVTFVYRTWSYQVLSDANPEGTLNGMSRTEGTDYTNTNRVGDTQGINTTTPDMRTDATPMISRTGLESPGSMYNDNMPAYEDDGTPTFVT